MGSIQRAVAVALIILSISDATAQVPADRIFAGRFEQPRGIVLWIADDLGAISTPAYSDVYPASSYADLRVFDKICDSGVRFQNVWSSPMCTPTRGSILTGRYGFRTNLGGAQTDVANLQPDIRPAEAQWSLPNLIALYGNPQTQLASYGKWHLGVGPAINGNCAPYTFGWDRYRGKIAGAQLDFYEDWEMHSALPPTQGGSACTEEVAGITQYATARNVDDAIAFVQSIGDAPFVLWLAFNAPHSPWQIPPPLTGGLPPMWSVPAGNPRPDYETWYNEVPECTDTGCSTDISSNTPWFEAMASNMDFEFDRLMQALGAPSGSIPSDVLVIAIGDNGTDNRAMPTAVGGVPLNQGMPAKQTVYEQGVRVPLCAAGGGVNYSGNVTDPVNLVDLYATILEAAGVPENVWRAHVQQVAPGTRHDSQSLWPYLNGVRAPQPREVIYTEIFNFAAATQSAAMSDGRYKYLRFVEDTVPPNLPKCFDLQDPANSPSETVDLLADGNPNNDGTCASLRLRMTNLVCSESYPGFPWTSWCD